MFGTRASIHFRARRDRVSATLAGIFVLAITAALSQLTFESAEAADTGSELVTYHDTPWPGPPTHPGTEVQDRLANATELVDFNKSDFAGAFVADDSRVVVVAASDRGEGLAREQFASDSGFRLARSSLSLDRVNELGTQLYESDASLAAKFNMWGIEPAGPALRVEILKPLDERDRAAIEAFAAKYALPIEINIDETAQRPVANDRLEDSSPFAGGFRFISMDASSGNPGYGSPCSAAFGYKITPEYMLSAGHCFELPYQYMWNTEDTSCNPCTKKNWIGTRTYDSWTFGTGSIQTGNDNAYHGDLSLANVSVAGKDAGAQIWWGGSATTAKIPVTVRRIPTIGDSICINGYVSGSDCGLTVQAINITQAYGGGQGTLRNGDKATSSSTADCSQFGDSGGSVVFDHSGEETQATAIGVVSGSSTGTGCSQYFTGIEEAIQAWGGNVKFS